MRILRKGFLDVLSCSLQLVNVGGRDIGRSITPFASCGPLTFISGNLEVCYTTSSLAPTSFDQEPNQTKRESLVSHNLEEEVYARHIRRVILKVKNGTVEDVVQSLKGDGFCCEIQLTANLVDSLLQKYGDDWKSALGFYEWASSHKGYKHTRFGHDRMVDLLGKMRQMDRMWDLVHKMHSEGFITLDTIAKVMRRLAGSRRWRDVVEFFDKLEYMGFVKDTETMNLLLDTLCKEKKVEVAHVAFFELKNHISPNAHTFNIFVHGWCNAHRVDEALWTFQEMKDLGFKPSVITYSIIIQAYCNQCNVGKAYELLDKMVADGCLPNIVTYTILMNSLAKAQKFDEALSIFEKVKSAGCIPDTLFYNSLINILGRAGRLPEAFHIFEKEMKMNGVNCSISTYNTMISISCLHKQWQSALNVLEKMKSSSCKPDLQTYRPLLKLCFSEGELDVRIHSLLNDMADKYHLSFDLDTYTTLIHGLCSVGDIGWATLLFDEMIDREILPRRQTCKMLLQEVEQRNIKVDTEDTIVYGNDLHKIIEGNQYTKQGCSIYYGHQRVCSRWWQCGNAKGA
ncbi:pentatricopeptide repeat-containing protein At3g04130, mitochondrial-like [Musa acuminata AAA Group]|uniref:pentatricopeptide repeat-containing protein At3g04130, mitochondrial-like n=1 Tax=Musa acuminata AAA Group TaxID=214697 RepID=UPI0031E3B24C